MIAPHAPPGGAVNPWKPAPARPLEMTAVTPTQTRMFAALESAAQRWAIPPALLRALAQAESGLDPNAMRFEPIFLTRYVPDDPERFGACSRETERTARATSWGLLQIMGQVAREQGCKASFLSVLTDPAQGCDAGARHLARLRDRHLKAHGWAGVVSAYNAGSPRRPTGGAYGNQPYVERVLALAGPLPQAVA